MPVRERRQKGWRGLNLAILLTVFKWRSSEGVKIQRVRTRASVANVVLHQVSERNDGYSGAAYWRWPLVTVSTRKGLVYWISLARYHTADLAVVGAATSIFFVATNVLMRQTHVLSRQKYACRDETFVATKLFVETKLFLWRQVYFSRDKRRVLSRQTRVCRDKYFVGTYIIL